MLITPDGGGGPDGRLYDMYSEPGFRVIQIGNRHTQTLELGDAEGVLFFVCVYMIHIRTPHIHVHVIPECGSDPNNPAVSIHVLQGAIFPRASRVPLSYMYLRCLWLSV